VLPIGGGVVGAIALLFTARAWSRRGRAAVVAPDDALDAALERRLDEALEEYDG
jgi:hypothetical protein